MSPKLSVVMPAHNEEGYLQTAVDEVIGALGQRDVDFEIILCENGSTDATVEIAKRLAEQNSQVTALELPFADYGMALRAGFLHAKGELIANVDVDAVDTAFLDAALGRMAEADSPAVVVGSKRNADSADERTIQRRLVTAVFTLILRVGFGLRVSDTHGLKMMRREPLVPLVEACKSAADIFDTELILRAERAGLVVTEIPITVVEQRPPRSPIIKRIPRTLLGLAKLRILLWKSAPRRRSFTR